MRVGGSKKTVMCTDFRFAVALAIGYSDFLCCVCQLTTSRALTSFLASTLKIIFHMWKSAEMRVGGSKKTVMCTDFRFAVALAIGCSDFLCCVCQLTTSRAFFKMNSNTTGNFFRYWLQSTTKRFVRLCHPEGTS